MIIGADEVPANSPPAALVSESDAAAQIVEAGIRAQWVELRFHVQVAEPERSFLKSPVEPREGFLVIAESDVDGGDVIGRNVFLGAEFEQLAKEAFGSVGRSGHSEAMREPG